MKTFAIFCVLFVLLIRSAFAQDIVDSVAVDSAEVVMIKYWRTKLNFSVNFNQASFSSNWTAGGINSIGINSLFNLKANYSRNRRTWDNEIDLLYGFVNNEGQGFRKTVDRVFLDTKYGYSFGKHWGFFSSFNFLTQFAPGFQFAADNSATLISDIFAPAFLTSAWGLEYRPVEYFKVRMSPFAPRITFVNGVERFVTDANPTPFGVEPPDNVRYEWLAFQMLAEFNKNVATNITLKWRYLMFANYETLALKTIDHRLDLNITAKVTRLINVGIGGILVYDFDQDSGVQFSQLLNVGFIYTFQNYK